MNDTYIIALLGGSTLDWILIALGLGAGLFLGVLWARRSGGNTAAADQSTAGTAEMTNPQASAQAADDALFALDKLHSLASSVREDVGQHNDQVLEINRELAGGQADEAAMSASLAKLLEANATLQEQLESAEQKLESQESEIEKAVADARTDALTQVTNRRGFDDFLARRVSEWQRRARPFCLLMMDVDHFKKFNDNYGHQTGDEVLRRIASSLSETARDMDFVTRYGGEEFAVIMADSVASEAHVACERMRAAIEKVQIPFEDKSLSVTVSLGLAEVTPADDMASIIRRADEALYTSKAYGRNCGHFHDGGQVVPLSSVQPVEVEDTQEADRQVRPEATAGSAPLEIAAGATDLPVRDIFMTELDRRIAESHRRGGELTILLIDIDDFDDFQQRFGTPTATKVFGTVGEFLGASFRKMDMIAQAGGSQFAVMLPGTHLYAAGQIAGRMQEAIAKCKIPIGGEELRLTVSVGLAELSAVDDAGTLFVRAKEALLTSRQAGSSHAFAQMGEGCVSLAEVELR